MCVREERKTEGQMSKGKCGKWLEEILADGEAHLCDDVREAAKKS